MCLHEPGAEEDVVCEGEGDLASVGGILHLEEGLGEGELSDDGHVIVEGDVLLGGLAHVALDAIEAVVETLRSDLVLLGLESRDAGSGVDEGLAASRAVEGLEGLVHEVAHVGEDLTSDLTTALTIEHAHDATDSVPGEGLALEVERLELAQRDGAALILVVLVKQLSNRINRSRLGHVALRRHSVALRRHSTLRRHAVALRHSTLRRHAVALRHSLRRHSGLALRGHAVTLRHSLRRHSGLTLRRHSGLTLRRHSGLTLRGHSGLALRGHAVALRHSLRGHSGLALRGHAVARLTLRRHAIARLTLRHTITGLALRSHAVTRLTLRSTRTHFL